MQFAMGYRAAVAVYTFYYNYALLPGYTPTSESTEHIQRRALNYNYAGFAKQNVFTVDRYKVWCPSRFSVHNR